MFSRVMSYWNQPFYIFLYSFFFGPLRLEFLNSTCMATPFCRTMTPRHPQPPTLWGSMPPRPYQLCSSLLFISYYSHYYFWVEEFVPYQIYKCSTKICRHGQFVHSCKYGSPLREMKSTIWLVDYSWKKRVVVLSAPHKGAIIIIFLAI